MKKLKNSDDLTKRQLQALKTKDSIYSSAMELFSKKGFNKVSIDDIVKKAGTSKGSFYTYFKSKNHVLLEQYKQFDNYYIKIYNELDKSKKTNEKLYEFIKEVFTLAVEKIGLDFTKVIYSGGYQYNREESEIIIDETRPLYRIIRELVKEGKANNEFIDEYNDRIMTDMIIRCLSGTYYDWCLYDGNFDLIESGMHFFAIFLKGITK